MIFIIQTEFIRYSSCSGGCFGGCSSFCIIVILCFEGGVGGEEGFEYMYVFEFGVGVCRGYGGVGVPESTAFHASACFTDVLAFGVG